MLASREKWLYWQCSMLTRYDVGCWVGGTMLSRSLRIVVLERVCCSASKNEALAGRQLSMHTGWRRPYMPWFLQVILRNRALEWGHLLLWRCGKWRLDIWIGLQKSAYFSFFGGIRFSASLLLCGYFARNDVRVKACCGSWPPFQQGLCVGVHYDIWVTACYGCAPPCKQGKCMRLYRMFRADTRA